MSLQPTSDSEPAVYWMSYSEYDSGQEWANWDSTCCMISVVLDAGSHEHFSGIRLIVVCENDLTGFVMKESTTRTWYPGVGRIGRSVNHRKALSQRREDLERGKLLLGDNHRSLPLCTVLFKAANVGKRGRRAAQLIPQLEIGSLGTFRISFDCVYPCTPTCRSVVAFLESTCHIPTPSRLGNSGIAVYTARILPCARSGSTFSNLPLSLLRNIVTLSHTYDGWRPALLRYALVCKAWSPLLDLFFEGFGAYWTGCPDRRLLARSLQQRPEKANLIKCLSAWDFKEPDLCKEDEYVRFYELVVKIVSFAMSLKRIEMGGCHVSLSRDYLNRLSQLRRVQKCEVYGSGQDIRLICDYPGRYEFGINDMQRCIMNWLELDEFTMNCWNNADDGKDDSEIPRFDSAIRYLNLTNGIITGPQLLKFISPTNPVLRRLRLEDIRGIPNSDFLEFLLQVSNTLVALSIRRCTISRDTDAEELALDATMPKMLRLITATIVGPGIAGPLAIARKAPTDRRPGWIKTIFIEVGSEDLRGLIQAAQVTGWENVVIYERHCLGLKGRVIEPLRKQVYDVAQERGLPFRFTRVPKRR